MGVATTLREYLEGRELAYDILEHSHSSSAMRIAESARIPGDQLAKPVLLGDDLSYLLAVIPATHRLELDRLNHLISRELELITEQELASTFSDCELGAIPAVGEPYGIDTLVDVALAEQEDVYFESGDHQHLIHMSGDDFRSLVSEIPKVHVSHHL